MITGYIYYKKPIVKTKKDGGNYEKLQENVLFETGTVEDIKESLLMSKFILCHQMSKDGSKMYKLISLDNVAYINLVEGKANDNVPQL